MTRALLLRNHSDKMAMFCKLPNPRTTSTLQICTLTSVCAARALPSSSALAITIYKEAIAKSRELVGSDGLDGPDTS